jgi:hypothetical protein
MKFLQVACGIGLAVTLMLAVSTFWINAYDHHLSLTDEFHVGVGIYSPSFHPRLVVFNNTDYGPYRGSLIGLSDGQGGIVGGPLQMRYFGDTAGIYYRWFLWPEGTIWTLMISLWYPIAFFSAALALCRMRLARQARSDSNSRPAEV